MRHNLNLHKKFSETQTQFFIGCLIIALEYVHSKKVVHRDIKPENLVLDSKGYLHLTDFGISKMGDCFLAGETSGTPGYMAPEVLFHLPSGKEIDWFAVGVLIYEFATGKRPYLGRSRENIKEGMNKKQVQLEMPGWTAEGTLFCDRLLKLDPLERLTKDHRNDPWFKGFDWDGVSKKEVVSPFTPPAGDNFNQKQAVRPWRGKVEKANSHGAFSGYIYYNTLRV